MSGGNLRKRDFLKAALLASFSGPALAQDQRVFGIKLPKELMRFIPGKPLNIAMTVDAIIRLEREADRKGLPSSTLERNTGEPIITVETSLYQLVLPRLVALIDRSEALDLGIADEAGGLLAELHATQHELPEALLSLPVGFNALPENTSPSAAIVPGDETPLSVPAISLRDVIGEPDVEKPTPLAADVPLLRARDFATLRPEYA